MFLYRSTPQYSVKQLKKKINDFNRSDYIGSRFISDELTDSYRHKQLIEFSNLINSLQNQIDQLASMPENKKLNKEIKDLIDAQVKKILKNGKGIKRGRQEVFSSMNRRYAYRFIKSEIQFIIKEKRKQNKALNCYVFDGSETKGLGSFLDKLSISGESRTQIIFKTEGTQHWSVLDVLKDESGVLKVFLLDSAGLLMNYEKIKAYCKRNRLDFSYSLGGIQKDNASCSTFAIDNTLDMSQMGHLHEHISAIRSASEEEDFFFEVSPMDLPPALVKNSQSTTFIEKYLLKHPEHELTNLEPTGETLREYADSHQYFKQGKKCYNAIFHKQSVYRNQLNNSSGSGINLEYDKTLKAKSEKIIQDSMAQIKKIKVDFKLCETELAVSFINKHIKAQFTEILRQCPVRDAEAVLNMIKPSDAVEQIIQEKKEEVTLLMEKRLEEIKQNKLIDANRESKSNENSSDNQSYISFVLEHPELLSAGIGLLVAVSVVTAVITCGVLPVVGGVVGLAVIASAAGLLSSGASLFATTYSGQAKNIVEEYSSDNIHAGLNV